MDYTCTRRISFCAGHRVHGHENKCRSPHGHNYVAEITCAGIHQTLDDIGRVIDFSVIKKEVGEWTEQYWDHAFIYWTQDDEMLALFAESPDWKSYPLDGNPTAENMAGYLLRVAGDRLESHGIRVLKVILRETENCWAEAYG